MKVGHQRVDRAKPVARGDENTGVGLEGPYFAILSPDFNELLFSTLVPGVGDQVFAVQGNKVILAGKAKEREERYGLNVPTFAVNALQPQFGGGESDGYLMLIDTGK